jgi:hypothetical protein
MSNYRTLFTAMAVVSLGVATPLVAQGRSAVSPAELDAAAATRPVGNRQAVRNLLSTSQAQTVAGQMGLSAAELSARVARLDDASLNLLAERAGAGDRDLAGGDGTIIISTTAVIIGLLLLILLIK